MTVINLFQTSLRLMLDGTINGERSGGAVSEGDVVVSDSGEQVRLTVGAVRMDESSRHKGERHPQADEIVMLLRGSAAIRLYAEDGGEAEKLALHPGTAAIVPAGVWHRIEVAEPSELLFATPRVTELRPAQPLSE
jgi:quercetin dioxygenase-like cupin family protein